MAIDTPGTYQQFAFLRNGAKRVDTIVADGAQTTRVYDPTNPNQSVDFIFDKGAFFATPDNTIDLGNPYYRFRDLYVASGIINTSDERQKKDMSPLDKIKDFFMSLNPVKYRYIDGTSGRMHHGLGAREVEQAMLANGLTDMDFAGLIKSPDEENEGEYIYGLRYTEFIPMLIKMVQDQQRKINALEARGSL